jgi:glutamyl-tRNA reductase
MHIVAVGLNYRTAPVHIREKFAVSEQQLPQALQMLKRTKSILECVIVGTCNRTELYAVVDRTPLCGNYIRGFMEQWFGVNRDVFNEHLYTYEGRDAVRHLFRVTSGLDSMIVGETQILGQVKNAFLLAQKQGTTGTLFNALFKQAVTFAKRAHSETAIGENPVSVSYAAVELGKRIFGSFEGKTVMIIGAGKMSELTCKHLFANGAGKVIVANRTYAKAEELAKQFQGVACGLEQALSRLAEADVVISSTGSDSYILRREQAESAMRKRKSRPLFLIDIAVPRDIDPEIGGLPNVFLYDIDDLEMIVESNLQERRKEMVKIEEMIGRELEAFDQWFRTLGVSPVIQALQMKAAAIHEETMRDLFNKLPDLDERERKVIRKLSKSIVNQMMRDPILRVKEMAAGRDREMAIEMFTQLFALEEWIGNREQAANPDPSPAADRRRDDPWREDAVAALGFVR